MGLGTAFIAKNTAQDSHLIGEAVPMYGALPYFKDGNSEYLRSGFLKQFDTKYKTYATRLPQSCFVDANINYPASGFTQMDSTFPNVSVFWDGTYYVIVYLNYQFSSGSPAKYGTTLSSLSSVSSWDANFSSLNSAIIFNGTILVGGNNNTTSPIAFKSPGSTTWSSANGTFSGNYIGCMAASPTIAVAHSSSSGSPYTSTDGVNWIARSYGGAASGLSGDAIVHWSPVLNAFVHTGNGSNIYTSPNGYTLTNVYNDPSVTLLSNNYGNYMGTKIAASSSTVTLISSVNAVIYRGSASGWTKVDLKSQVLSDPGFTPTYTYRLLYDSVNSRFLACGPNSFLYSFDGLTWYQGYTPRNFNSFTSISVANNKLFSVTTNTSLVITGIQDVTAALSKAYPDWVGGVGIFSAGTTSLGTSSYGVLPIYTRIS